MLCKTLQHLSCCRLVHYLESEVRTPGKNTIRLAPIENIICLCSMDTHILCSPPEQAEQKVVNWHDRVPQIRCRIAESRCEALLQQAAQRGFADIQSSLVAAGWRALHSGPGQHSCGRSHWQQACRTPS